MGSATRVALTAEQLEKLDQQSLVLVAGMVDILRHVVWDKNVPEFYGRIAKRALRELGLKE